jgi:hypothetical protein
MKGDSVDWLNGTLAAIVAVFVCGVIGYLALQWIVIPYVIRGIGTPPPGIM